MAKFNPKIKIDLPGYSAAQIEAIGLEVINTIIKRAKAGEKPGGGSFPGYSKEYKGSLDYKNAGKSSKVNLTLSGDMLDSIVIKKNTGKAVEIGFSDSDQEAKAEGNHIGSYGQDSGSRAKARPFFEVTKDELKSILKKYPQGTKKAEKRAESVLIKNEASDRLSGKVDLEELDGES